MRALPLSHIALPGSGAAEQIIGWRGAQPVTRAVWLQQVQAWHATLSACTAKQVALYLEDTLAFAAALYGAWHAGKHVVLPGDAQPATLQRLHMEAAVCAGDLPQALQPAEQVACSASAANWLPLSLADTQLSLFTSGSSGQPTRIDKCLRQLDAEVQSLHGLFGEVAQSPRVVATVSHQHIYGLLFRVLWPLAAGRETEAHMLRYPEQLLQHMVAHAPCVLVSSPALLQRLPEHLPWANAAPAVQHVFSSGGPLSAEASVCTQRLLGCSPIEVFGSSETGGVAWRQRAQHAEHWNLLPGVRSQIDAQGLLQVQSPHLPDAQTWWTTADQAQMHADGTGFCLLGRADRIVKIAEKRVSLTALEAAVVASAWVDSARAVVLPARDGAAAQRIGMVVQLNAQGWVQWQQLGRRGLGLALQSLVAAHVERVAWPRSWRYVEQLPMNAQGKCTQQQLALLFRPTLPQLSWLQRMPEQALGQWYVPADALVFDGHFPEAPLVPGVAQLHWVEWSARQVFDMPAHFVRAEVLKFQIPILPQAQVQLALQWLPAKQALQFALTSEHGTHASGRLIWEA